jgi:long-chain fatty acid transport protein
LQPTLGSNGGDAGDVGVVPSAYFSWQLNPRLFAGIGIGAPFGLKTEYDTDFVGRFHAIESELKTSNINPSIAYKVNDMFSVGAGINFQHADATLSNAVNYSAAAFGAGARLHSRRSEGPAARASPPSRAMTTDGATTWAR